MKDSVWENNLNFVKDVPTEYVKFIRSVITVSEKTSFTFALPLVHKWTW
jgi:hypothetical protein